MQDERQTQKLGLRRLSTEVSRAEELTKAVINWCLSYQTKVRGDSLSLETKWSVGRQGGCTARDCFRDCFG